MPLKTLSELNYRLGNHKSNNFISRLSEHFLLSEKKMEFIFDY